MFHRPATCGHVLGRIGEVSGRYLEERAEVGFIQKNQIGTDEFRIARQDARDGKTEIPAGIGAKGDGIADGEPACLGQARAHHQSAASDFFPAGGHERVVGLDDRIVVVPPKSTFLMLDASDTTEPFEIVRRYQIMAAGHHSLQKHLRRAVQHMRGFVAQGMAEQHDRCQEKDDQCVNEQQTERFCLASC